MSKKLQAYRIIFDDDNNDNLKRIERVRFVINFLRSNVKFSKSL